MIPSNRHEIAKYLRVKQSSAAFSKLRTWYEKLKTVTNFCLSKALIDDPLNIII